MGVVMYIAKIEGHCVFDLFQIAVEFERFY